METSDHKDLQFSLFFFSANEASTTQRKYDLLLESVKYADHNGFTAVWIPERHFHAFPTTCAMSPHFVADKLKNVPS